HDYATYAAASSVAGTKRNLVSVTDGAGGVFEAWEDVRSGRSDIYAQHITATGALASGCPADGLPVFVSAGDQATPVAVSDDDGGVIIAWTDLRYGSAIFAQRRRGDGSIAPGWIANGLGVTNLTSNQSVAKVVSDGTGGAFFVWRDARCNVVVFAQHLTATGGVATGW